MSSSIPAPPTLKLSICITTLNRASFIGATLDSILNQITDECEVVVLDAASTDDTAQVVSEFTSRFPSLRYVRQETNNGIDRDYDRAVELAAGEYCWLMTDDDFLKPGAIATVLGALQRDVSMVIVNAEARDLSMSKVLQPRLIHFELDRTYGPGEMDRLLVDVGDICKYIGIVVIERATWLSRDRARYFGTLFIHLGVVFQERLPKGALLIATPLVSFRQGNAHTFWPRAFETCMVTFPTLVWSFPISEAAKRQISSQAPWEDVLELLFWRGLGNYSLTEYRRYIRPRLRSMRSALTCALVAVLPTGIANAFLVSYYSRTRRRYQGVWEADVVLETLRMSRRLLKR